MPDSQDLSQLIVFSSSGTTGHPAKLPTHPATVACGMPLLEAALAPLGLRLPRGVGRNALVHLASYEGAYTTAIVVSYLLEAGCTRLNLRPSAWRRPVDLEAYLRAYPAPVVLADPDAYVDLLRLGLPWQPQALLSSITTLSPALADELTRRFGCPVLDLYALTETGILAVREAGGHRLLPRDVYVEILDESDRVCPDGVRGEITVTGGRNPYAPLLRYRTGDYASLSRRGQDLYLVDLEGRRPVSFVGDDGRIVHSMEVSRALRTLPLAQFCLRQEADGALTFRYRGPVDADAVRRRLETLFGARQPLALGTLPDALPRGRKTPQYECLRDPQAPGTEA